MININSRSIVKTSDGSFSIKLDEVDEYYHSFNGAYTESMHVYLNNGFLYKSKCLNEITILEVGFGTGLNALLTLDNSMELRKKVSYTAIEPFPLNDNEYIKLDYSEFVKSYHSEQYFLKMHEASFGQKTEICESFELLKLNCKIEDIELCADLYDLVYFDAFAPDVQPELWSSKIFEKLFLSLKKSGVLITYSAKGQVKRILKNCGFKVEGLPGAPGKREITRAHKIN